MAESGRFWNRVQEECRSAASRTRARAERTVRQGVLQVDLVSLRRDRRRVLGDLGERVLRLWSQGGLSSIEEDPEVRRLKSVVESIEAGIAAKEAEAAGLRQSSTGPAPATAPDVVMPK